MRMSYDLIIEDKIDESFINVPSLTVIWNGDHLVQIPGLDNKYFMDLELNKIYYKASVKKSIGFIEKEQYLGTEGNLIIYLNKFHKPKKLYYVSKIKEIVLKREERIKNTIESIVKLLAS